MHIFLTHVTHLKASTKKHTKICAKLLMPLKLGLEMRKEGILMSYLA